MSTQVSPKLSIGGGKKAVSVGSATLLQGAEYLVQRGLADEVAYHNVTKAAVNEIQVGKPGTKLYFVTLIDVEAKINASLTPDATRALFTARLNPLHLNVEQFTMLRNVRVYAACPHYMCACSAASLSTRVLIAAPPRLLHDRYGSRPQVQAACSKGASAAAPASRRPLQRPGAGGSRLAYRHSHCCRERLFACHSHCL